MKWKNNLFRSMFLGVCLFLVIIFEFGISSAIVASPDSLVIIDYPGAVDTRCQGVNNWGQVVGFYEDTDGSIHGFVYDKGIFSTIDVPGSLDTNASSINDYGQIVGTYDGTHGFLYDDEEFHGIDVPEALETRCWCINNRGQIVGVFNGSSGASHGFLYDNGLFTIIDTPDGPDTKTYGINNRGHIVGRYTYEDIGYGFLFNRKEFSGFGVPGAGGSGTVAWGINDCNVIVGTYWNNDGGHLFLYYRGLLTSFDVQGALNTFGRDINNSNHIVGFFSDVDTNIHHGFMAKAWWWWFLSYSDTVHPSTPMQRDMNTYQ